MIKDYWQLLTEFKWLWVVAWEQGDVYCLFECNSCFKASISNARALFYCSSYDTLHMFSLLAPFELVFYLIFPALLLVFVSSSSFNAVLNKDVRAPISLVVHWIALGYVFSFWSISIFYKMLLTTLSLYPDIHSL